MKKLILVSILGLMLSATGVFADSTMPAGSLSDLGPREVLEKLTKQLKQGLSMTEDMKVAFHFPNLNQSYTMHIFYGSAKLSEGASKEADLSIWIRQEAWNRFLRGEITMIDAIENKVPGVDLSGDSFQFERFMTYFGSIPGSKVKRY